MSSANESAAAMKAVIYQKMVDQLKCDLTIGLTDNNMSAWTDEQVAQYILAHHDAITQASAEMYDAYKNDGELADLGDGSSGEHDWYREFLYDHVTHPNDNIPDV